MEITAKQLINALSFETVENLLNNTFGQSYICEQMNVVDDGDDFIKYLLEEIIKNNTKVILCDMETAEVIGEINLRNYGGETFSTGCYDTMLD